MSNFEFGIFLFSFLVRKEKGALASSADRRKRWLEHYDPQSYLERSSAPHITYSQFINRELVAFSYYSNLRAIPSLMDGLKLSQRKVLYSVFKKKLR